RRGKVARRRPGRDQQTAMSPRIVFQQRLVGMKRVVLTGGPYAGKSTVIEELRRRGFATLPQAALPGLGELNARLGREEQTRWRRARPAEFQSAIAEKQAHLEALAEPGPGGYVFCDRGLLDGLAYCRRWGIAVPDRLQELVEQRRYAAIGVLDTLSGFQSRGE